MSLFDAIVVFNCVTLLFYGASCLVSARMQSEFRRYGIPQYRIMTGLLEIAGSIGVLVGLYIHVIGLLAASGLSILLLCGFGLRIKIRDDIIQSGPALGYCLLNAYIAATFFSFINNHS